ncbi:MAG: DNA polymerase III subunit chi [Simkaniaceae bacterium]|nr:DNA polymerase III subunit chi [Simkaniaceae bacterium]
MTNHNTGVTVTFFQVQTPKEKLERLLRTAHSHFDKKSPLLILTDSSKTTEYIDKLLWSFPTDSFLPHGPLELITVTENFETYEGTALFNLTTHPLLNSHLKTLYEYEDLTSPDKSASFKPRYTAYSTAGYRIVSL